MEIRVLLRHHPASFFQQRREPATPTPFPASDTVWGDPKAHPTAPCRASYSTFAAVAGTHARILERLCPSKFPVENDLSDPRPAVPEVPARPDPRSLRPMGPLSGASP